LLPHIKVQYIHQLGGGTVLEVADSQEDKNKGEDINEDLTMFEFPEIGQTMDLTPPRERKRHRELEHEDAIRGPARLASHRRRTAPLFLRPKASAMSNDQQRMRLNEERDPRDEASEMADGRGWDPEPIRIDVPSDPEFDFESGEAASSSSARTHGGSSSSCIAEILARASTMDDNCNDNG
jgi:hypothetical protein